MKRTIVLLAAIAATLMSWADATPPTSTATPTLYELAARIAAIEEFVATQKVEIAERKALVAARKKDLAAKADRRRKYAEAKATFEKEFEDYEAKYGQLVLTGYDTSTHERVYKRADGISVRFNVPEKLECETDDADTRRSRRRIRQ